jgi:hypothetical protein
MSKMPRLRHLEVIFPLSLVQQACECLATGRPRRVDILSYLADWHFGTRASLSTADHDFVIRNIFSPIAGVCSDRDESPSVTFVRCMRARGGDVDSGAPFQRLRGFWISATMKA